MQAVSLKSLFSLPLLPKHEQQEISKYRNVLELKNLLYFTVPGTEKGGLRFCAHLLP